MKLLDVDGDGMNELVVATSDGRLAIYKGLHCKRPWRVAENLGTISCFCVVPPFLANGGVPQQSSNLNSLLVLSTEGFMHVIDVPAAAAPDKRDHQRDGRDCGTPRGAAQ